MARVLISIKSLQYGAPPRVVDIQTSLRQKSAPNRPLFEKPVFVSAGAKRSWRGTGTKEAPQRGFHRRRLALGLGFGLKGPVFLFYLRPAPSDLTPTAPTIIPKAKRDPRCMGNHSVFPFLSGRAIFRSYLGGFGALIRTDPAPWKSQAAACVCVCEYVFSTAPIVLRIKVTFISFQLPFNKRLALKAT